MDLTFGSQRKTKLKEIADPQINIPELRADKAVIVEEQGKEYCIIYEAMLQPDQKELKMLKETSIVQEWLTESQQEGKLSLLEVILAQKLGALSPELMKKLQKLNDAQLNRLGLALHRINSRKALQAWLQNGASGNGNK